VIGVQGGKATGFLAVRVTTVDKQIYGIAIPDGAFIEVPGQGFARLADSYSAGAQVSLSAVSNYLTVPFRNFIVVPALAYQQAVTSQSVAKLLSVESSTNLSAQGKQQLAADIASIPKENTAIVPLPVQPVHLGSQTYFQPQKTQVADLLTKWWGVDPSKVAQVTRVILYNGAGIPGIAGEAAQQLIPCRPAGRRHEERRQLQLHADAGRSPARQRPAGQRHRQGYSASGKSRASPPTRASPTSS